MATSRMKPVLDQLRRAVLVTDKAGLTDGQLLESFVSRKDEAAFEALVRRHGPMVLGVCRRVLRNPHDAEDAFQATFLVLVRKAESVLPREGVANWLYGVAYRTALKARGLTARQRVRERQVTEMPEPEAVEPNDSWRDVQPLLDQELSRLPDKYRLPVVLCDLEGKSGKEAARQLGCPEGTVASRLSRGRAQLRRRLARHGLIVASGSLAVVLSQQAASASIPTALVLATVKAATPGAAGEAAGMISARVAVLVERVMKAMFSSHLKKATAVFLMAAVLCVPGSGSPYLAQAGTGAAAAPKTAQVDRRPDGKRGRGHSTLAPGDLRGKWTGEKNGTKVDVTFSGGRAHWRVEFKKVRKPKQPYQSPMVGVSVGADLRCVAERNAGRLNLYLPKYLGDKKEFKQNPSFNGLRPVGQVQRGAGGTIQLRIIPTGREDLDREDYDYPAVEGLILRRAVTLPK